MVKIIISFTVSILTKFKIIHLGSRDIKAHRPGPQGLAKPKHQPPYGPLGGDQ